MFLSYPSRGVADETLPLSTIIGVGGDASYAI